MRHLLVLLCAGFFLASGAVGAQTGEQETIAAPPVFAVGDTYQYKEYRTLDEARTPRSAHFRIMTNVVREIHPNGDIFIVDAQGNPSATRSHDFNLTERRRGMDTITYKPFWALYRYPMRVGDKYDTEFTHNATTAVADIHRKTNVRVVGWETVTVPAGTFKAIKVETSGKYRRSDNGATGTFREAAWLAPAVKMLSVLYSYEEEWDGSGGRARLYLSLDSFALK